MPRQAHVASIEALDDFRAKLVVYLAKAGRVLDDVRQEVVGMRIWLQTDRQLHWKHELRRRSHKLAQAEQELLSARLSGHPGAIQDRRMAVQRARNAWEEADRRLRGVKTWLGRYETEVESRLKAVNQLRQLLTQDMGKAVQFLETAGDHLAEYVEAGSTASSKRTTGGSGPSQTRTLDPAAEGGVDGSEGRQP